MMAKNKMPGGNRAGAWDGVHLGRFQYSTKVKRDGIPIYLGSKVIGTVEGGCFKKRISAGKHFLQKPRAIAFDIATLEDAEDAGAERVEIVDTDSGRVYRASMATIWADGKPLNRGHGRQWFLILDKWNREPSPTQGRLF
jgi:hypothetical protein